MAARSVRVGDELWFAALEKARTEGTTLTAVVQSALRDYVDGVAGQPEKNASDPAGLAGRGTDKELAIAHVATRPSLKAKECGHVYPDARYVMGVWKCRKCGTA